MNYNATFLHGWTIGIIKLPTFCPVIHNLKIKRCSILDDETTIHKILNVVKLNNIKILSCDKIVNEITTT